MITLLFVCCKESRREDPGTQVPRAGDTVQAMEDNKQAPHDKAKTGPLAAIRQRVEYINTADLKKKTFEFMCDEKMVVDYFYEGDEIVKITVDFGTVGDVYAREGYYYRDGKLIFIYEFVEGGPACEGCIKKNEYRTYVDNDKTIKYMRDANVLPCRKCDFDAASRYYKLLKASAAEEIKAIMCK